MGHSILIGWYHPGSKRFCYKDVKKYQPETRKGYTMPVYAVLEDGMREDLEVENKRLREVILLAPGTNEENFLEQYKKWWDTFYREIRSPGCNLKNIEQALKD